MYALLHPISSVQNLMKSRPQRCRAVLAFEHSVPKDLKCIAKMMQKGCAAAQVLRLLSQAYLLSGQAAHAYACVQSVRELQDPSDNPPSLCLTAIEALIQVITCTSRSGLIKGCKKLLLLPCRST